MPLKLLVIENDRSAAMLMTQVFLSHGAEVQTAADADAASALTSRTKFDGIFLELGLAGGNGVELTEHIRQSSWNSRTPIVLVSRTADARAAARAFQAGGTFFLPKPMKQNAVRRALLSTRAVMLDERRRYSRILLPTPVECFLRNRELPGCMVHNVSSSGMLFQHDGSLSPRDDVRLHFRIEKAASPVVARAVIVRVDGEQRAGARFVAMSFDDRERILKRVAAEVDNL